MKIEAWVTQEQIEKAILGAIESEVKSRISYSFGEESKKIREFVSISMKSLNQQMISDAVTGYLIREHLGEMRKHEEEAEKKK